MHLAIFTPFALAATLVLPRTAAMEFTEHFFVLPHNPLTAQRLDPIVSPGELSGHVHAIVGGNKFSQTYSFGQTQSSTCSTAAIQADKSNYWAPQMYIKEGTGFKLAPLQFAMTYYFFGRKQPGEKVTAFPDDFRMLAGDAKRTTFSADDPAQDAVRYICLGASSEQTHEFPKGHCPDGVRAQIHFPNCWNGKDSWLKGSKHVVYGKGYYDSGGICPEGFKTRLPMIQMEFIYKDATTYEPGNRIWANGDQQGYAFHADFANGWRSGLLQQVIDGPKCTSGFNLKTCPVLSPLIDDAAKSGCKYAGQIVDEPIGNVQAIPALPGPNAPWANAPSKRRIDDGHFA